MSTTSRNETCLTLNECRTPHQSATHDLPYSAERHVENLGLFMLAFYDCEAYLDSDRDTNRRWYDKVAIAPLSAWLEQ